MKEDNLFPALLSLFSEEGGRPSKRSPLWNLFVDHDGQPLTEEPPPCACVFDERFFFWALRNLPLKEACQHLAMIGTIGSGKTTLIRLLLQSIAPRFRRDWKGPAEQLVLFDAKTELIPIVEGMGLTSETTNLHILNPFDKRGIAWSIAEGVQEPGMALNFATIVIPEEPGSTAPFFALSARNMVYGAILGLNARFGTHWTIRDLICALDSKATLKSVVSINERAAAIVARAMADTQHVDGVVSHVGARLVQLEPLAALWQTTLVESRFSVEDFLSKPGVLVLGGDPTVKEVLQPLNALLLKVLTQEIIRGPGSSLPRRWFILDEFAAMGRVECMADLLRLGRSKGAAVLLGVQSIEGVEACYGPGAADDLLSLCTYKTFLRAGGPKTAEWASKYFDAVRREETTYSKTWGTGHGSHSISYAFHDRQVFLPSVFLDLPLPAPGGPFVAIHDIPCLRQSSITQRGADEIFAMVQPEGEGASFDRRHARDQTLIPWTDEEAQFATNTPKKGDDANSSDIPKPPDPTQHKKRKKRP